MSKLKNIQTVEGLKEKVGRAKSIAVTDHTGLSVNSVNELRDRIKEADAELVVAKNSLIKIALTQNKIDTADISKDLTGPSSIVLSYKDPVSPIKAIFDFAKKHVLELPKIKSAIIEGVYSDSEKVQVIKTLPTKEQLVSRALGGLQAPVRGFVTAMGGMRGKFVYAVKAIADKKASN